MLALQKEREEELARRKPLEQAMEAGVQPSCRDMQTQSSDSPAQLRRGQPPLGARRRRRPQLPSIRSSTTRRPASAAGAGARRQSRKNLVCSQLQSLRQATLQLALLQGSCSRLHVAPSIAGLNDAPEAKLLQATGHICQPPL